MWALLKHFTYCLQKYEILHSIKKIMALSIEKKNQYSKVDGESILKYFKTIFGKVLKNIIM
jgi:DNA relaxase NicK